MPRSLILLGALALLLPGSSAQAHKGSKARLTLRVQQQQVELTLRATRHDLAPTLEVAEGINPLGVLYRTKRQTVLRNIAAYITLESGGRLCKLAGQRLGVFREKIITVTLSYRCPRRVELLKLKYDLLFDLDPRHRCIVSEAGADNSVVLTSARRLFHLEQQVSPWDNAADFLVLGVEHIFTGYDHLAFLLGLLLVAGIVGEGQQSRRRRQQIRYMLAIVTSFTVAHSVTLVATALSWIDLPSRIVEPAIALSIAYVGVENLLTNGAPRRRWLLAMGFGLIHGFGFAHMLRDIGLPRSGLVLSLASFNLGVELGQLGVVLLLYPVILLLSRRAVGLLSVLGMAALLAALVGLLALADVALVTSATVCGAALVLCVPGVRRWGYRTAVLRGGSLVIALLGLLWLVERLAGITLLGGHLG